MSFGQRLRELREAAAISQTALAKHAGVTRNAVSLWEHDKSIPETKRLERIAGILQVPIDRLMSPSKQVREKVLQLATRLFDRVGFEETSVEAVCAASDISRQQFDSLFTSKEALLHEVLKEFTERAHSEVRRIPPKYGSLAARLKQLLRIYCSHDLAHPKLTAAMHAHSWSWSDAREREHSRQMSEYHDTVYALLEEAAQQGQIDQGNFRAASNLILASYTYLLRKALFDGYDADKVVALLEPLIALALEGLHYRIVAGFADRPANSKRNT